MQHLSAAWRATTVHKVSYATICHSLLVHLKYYSCKVCYTATAVMMSKATFSFWMKRFTFCPTLRKKVTGERLLNVTVKNEMYDFDCSFPCRSSHFTTVNWYQRSLLRSCCAGRLNRDHLFKGEDKPQQQGNMEYMPPCVLRGTSGWKGGAVVSLDYITYMFPNHYVSYNEARMCLSVEKESSAGNWELKVTKSAGKSGSSKRR